MTYHRAKTIIEAINAHRVVAGGHCAIFGEDPTVSVSGAVERHSLETAVRSLKLIDVDSCSSFVFDGKC